MIGNESFPATFLDLPCVVESYKTYDDNMLIKTTDIGQVRSCSSCFCTDQARDRNLTLSWHRWLWSEKKAILPQKESSTGMASPLQWGMLADGGSAENLISMYFTSFFSFHLHHYHDYLVAKSYFHLQPELVQRVEKDLLNIMSGGTVENILKSLNSWIRICDFILVCFDAWNF